MDKIYVTKPSLAPLDEYVELLKSCWQSGILTHNGPLVQKLEKKFEELLCLPSFVAVTNGTVALQMAIKALSLKGEIITTPFTWIATVSAIRWEGCEPVFCDIDSETYNIDYSKIEDLITEKTVAIMPVHVFGNPCEVFEIEKIAQRYKLAVVYDAAHAIGSTVHGKSLLNFGDISATSLHATKLINTGEGGACISAQPALQERLKRIRFFGHDSSGEVVEDGFNGKMTEIHAALGLANLKYFHAVLDDRKLKYKLYKEILSNSEKLNFQKINLGEPNYSYFPIVLESEQSLLKVVRALNDANIFPRRYFYPSINKVLKQDNVVTPISDSISTRILCLPLYKELKEMEIEKIARIILNSVP